MKVMACAAVNFAGWNLLFRSPHSLLRRCWLRFRIREALRLDLFQEQHGAFERLDFAQRVSGKAGMNRAVTDDAEIAVFGVQREPMAPAHDGFK